VYGEYKLFTEVNYEEFASSSHIKYATVSDIGQEFGEAGVANCVLPENEGFADGRACYGAA
jgi:hypothetical protein